MCRVPVHGRHAVFELTFIIVLFFSNFHAIGNSILFIYLFLYCDGDLYLFALPKVIMAIPILYTTVFSKPRFSIECYPKHNIIMWLPIILVLGLS